MSTHVFSTSDDCFHALSQLGRIARARALDTERLRTLHPEVVEALRASNLLGIAAPREVGGSGCDPLTQLEVYEATARHDSSAGWALMISATLAAFAGAYLDESAAAHVFEGKSIPPFAGHLSPSGVATEVSGGYRVRGRWPFASGIPHARWVYATAFVGAPPKPDDTTLPEMISFVVPIGDATIDDTWHSAGLRGSGSHHFRIEEAFVPSGFAFPFPLAPAHRGEAFHRLPIMAVVTPGHVGFALGAARAALDALSESVPTRVRMWSRIPVLQHASFHTSLGRAVAQLAAARAYAVSVIRQLDAIAHRDGAPTMDEWSSIRTVVAHVTDVATDVARFAFHAGGSGALFDESPLQRSLRDLLAASQHVSATEEAYELAGQIHLGIAGRHPLLASLTDAR